MFKRNTAQTVYAVVVNATTGAAETSGVAITVSKDGGAGASGAGTLAHISGGLWAYTFTAGELDAASVGFIFTKSGAVPAGGSIRTVQVDPDDDEAMGLAHVSTILAAVASILELAATSGVAVAEASKAGYSLAAGGLDAPMLEADTNARQGLSLILAMVGGVITGAGTTSPTIRNRANSANRVTMTTDASGNRSSVAHTPYAG